VRVEEDEDRGGRVACSGHPCADQTFPDAEADDADELVEAGRVQVVVDRQLVWA
jgi:hypothetical protein